MEFDSEWIFGFGRPDQVCTGILKLPKNSETLAKWLEFVTIPCSIQPWRGQRLHRKRREQQENGQVWGVETLPWGCAGPKAFTHFLKVTGEISYAMEKDMFYPVFGPTLERLFARSIELPTVEKPMAYSVHIFGSAKQGSARAGWVATFG